MFAYPSTALPQSDLAGERIPCWSEFSSKSLFFNLAQKSLCKKSYL